MAYEVLARKWRPQQFGDVVGQEHVTTTLRNAIQSNRLANAYLFVGPRGTGKTSVARILAKALNCEKGPTVTPCDKCDSCREIAAGTSLDVLEIDGASNNSVDQVRDLRDTVKYMPTHGTYRIYVIDEVHMLSTAAFNALLKTLEEPPPHVKFIFATTEPHKVLATIVSRCQRFDLRRIPVGLIIQRLQVIAKTEKVTISDDALLAIARGAEGGLRDAESALDQLIAFKGNRIEEEDVLSVFGLVSRGMLEDLGERILKKEVKGLIRSIGELDQAGKDLQRLVFELMEHFRNLLVCLCIEKPTEGLDLTEAQLVVLRKQAALSSTERVLRVIRVLTETEERMRYALSKRTLLETALIRCARATSVVTLEEILMKINALREGEGCAGGNPDRAVRRPAADDPPDEVPEPVEKPAETSAGDDPATQVRERPPTYASAPGSAGGDLQKLRDKWDEIVGKAGRMAIRTKHILADARPISIDGNKVVIGFDPEFADELDNFRSPRNRVALEHAIQEAIRRNVTVELRVISAEDAPESDPGGADPGRHGEDKKASAKGEGEKGKQRSRKELLDDPAVQKTLEAFKGKILDVRS